MRLEAVVGAHAAGLEVGDHELGDQQASVGAVVVTLHFPQCLGKDRVQEAVHIAYRYEGHYCSGHQHSAEEISAVRAGEEQTTELADLRRRNVAVLGLVVYVIQAHSLFALLQDCLPQRTRAPYPQS